MKTIFVNKKSVYGNDAFYPACDFSRMIAIVAGTKTLTTKALKTLKDFGYEIEIAPQENPFPFFE